MDVSYIRQSPFVAIPKALLTTIEETIASTAWLLCVAILPFEEHGNT
jgi:hypothetical protein